MLISKARGSGVPKRRALRVIVGLVLVLAVVVQVRSSFLTPAAIAFSPEKIVPVRVAGWTVESLPLGETEQATSAAEKLLALDSFAYRTYRSEAVQVSIYVAYWRPENPARDNGLGHSPDTCWVLAGMRMGERADTAGLAPEGQPLNAGHRRKFVTVSGEKTEVVYWHLTGGEPSRFWWQASPSLPQRLSDAWTGLASGQRRASREERVYVRFHSNAPAEAMMAMKPVVETLRNLGGARVPVWAH